MCAPAYFKVRYSINPWMDPSRPADADRAMDQWQKLVGCLLALGHKVDFIEPVPDLPDMTMTMTASVIRAAQQSDPVPETQVTTPPTPQRTRR